MEFKLVKRFDDRCKLTDFHAEALALAVGKTIAKKSASIV